MVWKAEPSLVLAAHLHAVDRNLLDVVLVDVTHELGDIYFFVFLAVARALDHFPEQQGRDADQQPEQYGLYS